MLSLLAATTEFAASKPWEYMFDSDVVGLIDPATGEMRLAAVLGHAGEVFGVAFYRRPSGLRWLLKILNDPDAGVDPEDFSVLDASKVELVRKSELRKEELSLLNALNFKAAGRGPVWPQFQSVQPGWLPWFIDQTEAQQLLSDLPRLTAFTSLFREHPDLFENRPRGEIPFLPNPMPNRPLRVEDLEWRPLIAIPETFDGFQATNQQLAQLRALKRDKRAVYEYGHRLLLGSSVIEQGRPCRSRVGLLVDHHDGLVLGFDLSLAPLPFAESAGMGLIEALMAGGSLPGTLLVDDHRLEPILGPLCAALDLRLKLSDELANLAEAHASLENHMQTRPR
ncbi:MAG: hypothetical protein JWR69_686 [Pedosphaera sp.]|nr:hypothetical protein [Pedosphaera sp.]